jgi:hypothetical protein
MQERQVAAGVARPQPIEGSDRARKHLLEVGGGNPFAADALGPRRLDRLDEHRPDRISCRRW